MVPVGFLPEGGPNGQQNASGGAGARPGGGPERVFDWFRFLAAVMNWILIFLRYWTKFGLLAEGRGWPHRWRPAVVCVVPSGLAARGREAIRARCVLPGFPAALGDRTVLSKPAHPAGG